MIFSFRLSRDLRKVGRGGLQQGCGAGYRLRAAALVAYTGDSDLSHPPEEDTRLFIVHHSNRMERLARELAAELRRPLSHPLVTETVVVPHPGMGRWLSMSLADVNSVQANVEMTLPAAYLWRLIDPESDASREVDPWGRDALAWRIYHALPDLVGGAGFSEVGNYLSDERDGLAQWELATRLADLFDQYQVYRPEWISDWQRGRDQHWQAELWRAVVGEADDHRVARIERFVELWRRGAPVDLPERMSLFAISSLPPQQFELFRMLAERIDVHLYFHNPSEVFWGDLVSERVRSRALRRLDAADADAMARLLDVGNPLLASLGMQGQQFLNQLYDNPPDDDVEAFDGALPETLLGRLQRSILHIEDGGGAADDGRSAEGDAFVDAGDDSIELHVAHGPLREVQVLCDRLLALFDDDPTLSPRDVVVMVPEIETFVPCIEAVFGALPGDLRIPYAIADRSPRDEWPVLGLIDALLKLPSGRLGAGEALDLLELAPVGRRFELGPAEVERLRQWIEAGHIRWGYDGNDKQAFDLPPEPANTWRAGFDRMLAGFALPETAGPYRGIVPLDGARGAEMVLLGRLMGLVDRLQQERVRLRSPRSLADWRDTLEALLDQFTAPDDDDAEALSLVREALDRLCEEAQGEGDAAPVSLAVFRAALERRLTPPRLGANFLAGTLTFCAFQPMRSIPFRVVCLLGLDQTAFPRRERRIDFDLMRNEPKRGDRSRRQDDRYAFLEALLSARERLILSYSGRDARDDLERQPSTLVRELGDFLDQFWRRHGGGPVLTEQIHSLQPFAARNFDGERPSGFHPTWCAIAARLADPARDPAAFFRDQTPLPAPDDEWRVLDLSTLIRFHSHPIRFFLQNRVRLYLGDESAPLDDQEPFALEGLAAYGVRARLLDALLQGHSLDRLCERILAEGLLPHGAFGRHWLRSERAAVEQLGRRLGDQIGAAAEPVSFDLSLAGAEGGFRLQDRLHRLNRKSGLLRARSANLTAGDVISTWIEGLVLAACGAGYLPRQARHVGRDGEIVWRELPASAEARDRLAELCDRYWQGLRRPAAFLPLAAWDQLKAELTGHGNPVARGRERWEEGYHGRRGDSSDPYIALLYRDREPPHGCIEYEDALEPLRAALAGANLSPGLLR